MKSIKQQYIDLKEGKMSQANFMRNLRMTLPQYVTNVTSYNDAVKILRNKGILNESLIKQLEQGIEVEKEHTSDEIKAAEIALDHLKEKPDYYTKLKKAGLEENKNWTNASGKELYSQFKEIDNLNSQEVLIGIDFEIEQNHELSKEEAVKIVIKNLKKNPYYYTTSLMAGKKFEEIPTIGKLTPGSDKMKEFKGENDAIDKDNMMKPVKGIDKPKKDSDKGGEKNKMVKNVSSMSLVAKTSRGVQKMAATGEKMKTIREAEEKKNTDTSSNTKSVPSTIFSKNAKLSASISKLMDKDPNAVSKQNRLKDIIRELIKQEMYDGMEPMSRKELDETDIYGIAGNPEKEKEARLASIKKSKPSTTTTKSTKKPKK